MDKHADLIFRSAVLLFWLIFSTSQALSAPTDANTPAGTASTVRVERSYYKPETITMRDNCINKVQNELRSQLDLAAQARGITVSDTKLEWLGSDGIVTDDTKGFETFQFQLTAGATKGSVQAVLVLKYPLHAQIWTSVEKEIVGQKIDDLGNIIDPGTTYLRTKKMFLIFISSLGRKALDVVNLASGKTVFSLADRIAGEPADYLGTPLRLQTLECRNMVESVAPQIP